MVQVPLSSLPAPTADALAHSVRLMEVIRAEISANGGSISFRRFMELALYAPRLGYYSAGAHKFGAAGDFVTAPEISPLFARCLARQCEEILRVTGGGILELGAGSGVLSADLLLELERLDCLPEHYWILELSGELRSRQHACLTARIPRLLDRVAWLDRLPAEEWNGVILGNEVLDALPVERFRVTARGPVPLWVVWEREGFAWREGRADAGLIATFKSLRQSLGRPPPVGYESEFSPHLTAWIASLAEHLRIGAMLFVDYGYPRREYYHPQRVSGTLLCHYRHHAHADPFFLPGLQDITANVDFTAVAEAGVASDLAVAGYTSQGYFLLGCGLMDMLAEVDASDTRRYLELTRQVKLLTLPGEMGERFKVIALGRGLDRPPRGFALFDERGRL